MCSRYPRDRLLAFSFLLLPPDDRLIQAIKALCRGAGIPQNGR